VLTCIQGQHFCITTPVIRFHRYNKDAKPINWYRAKLILYFPWYDEDRVQYATYEEHYNSVRPLVLANKSRYSQADVDDIEVDENGPPEHLWNEIAPSAEESRSHSLQEGSETLAELSQEDLQEESGSGPTGLSMKFEVSAIKREIPANEYRRLLRQLNAKQRDIIVHHRSSNCIETGAVCKTLLCIP